MSQSSAIGMTRAMQAGTDAAERAAMRIHARHPILGDPVDAPTCGVCGLPLADDPDDRPDHPAGPLCGPCHRARAFDETLWELDLTADGDPW